MSEGRLQLRGKKKGKNSSSYGKSLKEKKTNTV